MKPLDKEQLQENSYSLPYHYLDLSNYSQVKLNSLEYLDYLRVICNEVALINPKNLLDFGCGDGRFAFELPKRFNYTGIDTSSRAITFSRIFNPDSNFIIGDMLTYNFKEKFDCVTAIEVIEHLNPMVRSKIIKSLSKVIEKNGKLIITVPSKNIPITPKHYQHFTVEELDALFIPHGFKRIKSIGHNIFGIRWELYVLFRRMMIVSSPLFNDLEKSYAYKFLIRLYKRCNIGPVDKAQQLIVIYKKE